MDKDEVRKILREILLDKESFPEERKALIIYLQGVIYDIANEENGDLEIVKTILDKNLQLEKENNLLKTKVRYLETDVSHIKETIYDLVERLSEFESRVNAAMRYP